MIDNSIPEELVSLIHAISEDNDICERLFSLQQLPSGARQAQLVSIAAQMRAAGEDPTLADAVFMLAQPQFYAAACNTCEKFVPDGGVMGQTYRASAKRNYRIKAGARLCPKDQSQQCVQQKRRWK